MTRTERTATRQRVPHSFPYVLMYHSVSEYTDDPYLVTVDPARFERQLRWLRARGCTGVSMRELLAARRAGRARGLVGLTFDDGYTDFAEHAVPLLRAYGFRAELFVVSGLVGGDNAWEPEGFDRFELMGWDALETLPRQTGTVGAHLGCGAH